MNPTAEALKQLLDYRYIVHSIKWAKRELPRLLGEGAPKLPGNPILSDMSTAHAHRMDAVEIANRIMYLKEHIAVNEERIADINRVLNLISVNSDKYGVVLRLSYIESKPNGRNYTVEEIAEMLNYSPNYVSKIRKRAVRRFVKYIA